MSYDTMASASSMLGLLFFLLLFAGVLFWVFWPKNRERFEDAARIPLREPDMVDREHKNQVP